MSNRCNQNAFKLTNAITTQSWGAGVSKNRRSFGVQREGWRDAIRTLRYLLLRLSRLHAYPTQALLCVCWLLKGERVGVS
jgi:hypothetical protein